MLDTLARWQRQIARCNTEWHRVAILLLSIDGRQIGDGILLSKELLFLYIILNYSYYLSRCATVPKPCSRLLKTFTD